MAVINTNVKALFSQAALASSARAQTVAMQQLSTGKRINSSRDDAAGMAIATRMTHQIRSLNQAVRNAGDAVSMIQTAEGAVNEVTDMLQRMRELAIQAATDTNSNDQRSYLDLEFQQLKKQIVQISENTEWNGFPLLNGTAGEIVGPMPVYKATGNGMYAGAVTMAVSAKTSSETVDGIDTSHTGVLSKVGKMQLTVSLDSGAPIVDADGYSASASMVLEDGTSLTLKGKLSESAPGSSGYDTITFKDTLLTDNKGSFTITTAKSGGFVNDEKVAVSIGRSFEKVEAIKTGDVIINGVSVPLALPKNDTLSPQDGNQTSSAIARAAAINEVYGQTGVRAVVDETVMTGAAMSGDYVLEGKSSGTVTINGYVSAKFETVTNNTRASREAAVKAINAISDLTGVVAKDTGLDEKGIVLTAKDGRNIAIGFNSADSTTEAFSARTGLKQGLQVGTYSLESKVETQVNITTASNGSIERAGLTVGDFSQNISRMASATRADVNPPVKQVTQLTVSGTVAEGDSYSVVINGKEFTYSAVAGDIEAPSDPSEALYFLPGTGGAPGTAITKSDADWTVSLGLAYYDGTSISNTAGAGKTAAYTNDGGTTAIMTSDPSYKTQADVDAAAETATRVNIATQLAEKINSDDNASLNVHATVGEDGQLFIESVKPGVPFTYSASAQGDSSVAVQTIVENSASADKPLRSGDLVINGVMIPGTTDEDDIYSDQTAYSSNAGASAIAIANAINSKSSLTNVKAVASSPVMSATAAVNNKLPATGTYLIYVNGVGVTVDLEMNETPDQRLNKVILALKKQEGEHGVVASKNAVGGLKLETVDGRNLSVWFDPTQTPVAVPDGYPRTEQAITAAMFGLQTGTHVPQRTEVTLGGSIQSGDILSLKVNGMTVHATATSDDPADLAQALKDSLSHTDMTGIDVEVNDDGQLVLTSTQNAFEVGGVDLIPVDENSDVSVGIQSYEWNLNELNAYEKGASIPKPVAGDVRAIEDASTTSWGAKTLYGTVSLVSEKQFSVEAGTNGFGASSNFSQLGFSQGTFGGRSAADLSPPRVGRMNFQVGASANQTISFDLADFGKNGPITQEITWDVDLDAMKPGDGVPTPGTTNPIYNGKPLTRSFISSKEAALEVLNKLDATMDKVNGTRATMGAVMNRLDYVITNLTNVSMNLSASRSQIEDADYASASTELAKTQIMQQAATAVLAQANTSQQSVLKLLQGG